jgi:hypothetical protein
MCGSHVWVCGIEGCGVVIAHMGQAVLDGRVVLGYDPRRGASVCSLATPRPRPSRVGFGYASECHVAMIVRFRMKKRNQNENVSKRWQPSASTAARTAAAGTGHRSRRCGAPHAVSRLSTLNPPLPLTAASALPTRVSSLTRRSTPVGPQPHPGPHRHRRSSKHTPPLTRKHADRRTPRRCRGSAGA